MRVPVEQAFIDNGGYINFNKIGFRIELPIPPEVLRPNGRTRNYKYKNAVAQDAKQHGLAAVREKVASNPFQDGPLNIRYTYYPPAPRGNYLDDDNLIGAMKYYRDGIAKALDINDKRFITYPVLKGARDGRGRVVVEIWQEAK